jgi:SAM-dependent methyltransferase
MEEICKAVRIKDNEYIHLAAKHLTSNRPHRIFCGISTYINRPPGDLRSTNRVITEVDSVPTCPKCIEACIERINHDRSFKTGADVIIHAYNQIFSPKNTKNGKCGKTHRELINQNHNYPYIPNSCIRIAEHLSTAFHFIKEKKQRPRPLRFLDAGCGIGNIVALASAVGFKSHGIELNTEYLKIARRLAICMSNRPYFKCANIITFDKYHTYDLIYYYVPIQDYILQAAFEIHLIRKMSVGSFMLPSGSSGGAEHATSEGYFKRHLIEQATPYHTTRLYEKIKEVPKDWISEDKDWQEKYEEYVKCKGVNKKWRGPNGAM